MPKYILLLGWFCCFYGISLVFHGQDVVYQETFCGGVSGAGFSTGMGVGTGATHINIEPNSTIKKVIMLHNRQGYASDISFEINGIEIHTDTLEFHNKFNSTSNWCSPKYIFFRDITEDIILTSNTISISIPPQSNPICWVYNAVYFVVLYENLSMPQVNISIVFNKQNLTGNEFYVINSLNPIDTNYDAGFALFTDRICDFEIDGNNIFVNNYHLGLTWGGDGVDGNFLCTGVKGHFYYQNNQLFGLDDDMPDSLMNQSDGLANISSYISNNVTSLSFQLVHANYPNQSATATNANLAYFLAYTTPCQPFETTLTEEVAVCRGESAQLLATGGTSTGSVPGYEWLPQEDLSCYDCPNPVFLGDSTRHYTVRIWSTDSCSKVLPVKVLVYDLPTQANLTLNPATCSESNGSLSISNVVGGTPQYVYNIGDNSTTNPNFNNLATGVYNLQITDANTCTYNQAFTIEEINPVTAAFSTNPQQGVAPLNVNFTNQSTGANLYQWLVNTQTFETFNLNYTFDTAGTYPVQLIATYNEPHCADTALKVVVVENDFNVIIPTIFHSAQGTWSITTSNVVQIKAQVYNAIGQLIHQTQQTANNGSNSIWPANENATGYYFYRLLLTDVEGKEHGYEGKVLVVR